MTPELARGTRALPVARSHRVPVINRPVISRAPGFSRVLSREGGFGHFSDFPPAAMELAGPPGSSQHVEQTQKHGDAPTSVGRWPNFQNESPLSTFIGALHRSQGASGARAV